MASTSIMLKHPNGKPNEVSRLVCQLRDGRDVRIVLSTGISVKRKHWSKWFSREKLTKDEIREKANVKKNVSGTIYSGDPKALEKNKALSDFEKLIYGIYTKHKNSHKINTEFIQQKIEDQKQSNFINNTDDIIEQLEIYLNSKTNKSKDFIRTAKPVIQHLSHYLNTRKIRILKFNDLNKPFLEGYEHYLSQEQHEYVWKGKAVKKGCLKSGTVNRHFTHLKILCKNLMGEIPINNAIFQHTVTEINEESRVLNWNELKLILDAPTATDKQQLSKDIFLFSCFSGMRISASQELRPGDIHGGFIHWINTKSKKQPTVQTTIHKYNYGIIKKYKALKGSKLFPPISQQRMNVNIKTLCKSVGIEKPEEIHNHTGRHSYNSLLYVLGIDVFVRNEELGHAHGNINQQVYTSLDENERKTLIVNTMENLETLLAQKQRATSKFDEV